MSNTPSPQSVPARLDPVPSGPAAATSGPAGAAPPGSGAAVADLPLPHERDQALQAVNPEPQPLIEQARRDIEAGQVDTDLRATPGLDAQQRQKLVPGAGGRR